MDKSDWAIQHSVKLANYKIIRQTGAGSKTATYLAEDMNQKQVSLTYLDTKKLVERYRLAAISEGLPKKEADIKAESLAKNYIQQQADTVERVSELSHEHVAQMTNVGYDESKGLYFIISEYVPGVDLFYATRGLTPMQMLYLFSQILDGLNFIHMNQLLHLNVKPSRIRVDLESSTPLAKLTDFGFAIPMDGYEGEYGGTPLYMAPEVALQQRNKINESADLFSFGVTAYYCLSRKQPFEERCKVKNDRKLLSNIVSNEKLPPTPSHFSKEVPKAMDELIMSLLKHDTESRIFETASQVLDYFDERWPNERLRMPHEDTTTLV